MQNDLFNVNLAVFLSQLRSYSKHHNLRISQSTSDMMVEVADLFDEIFENSVVKNGQKQNDADFIFKLRSDEYELRTNIICYFCLVGFRNIEIEFFELGHFYFYRFLFCLFN